ncbi:MAG: hypothetical protein RIQ89_1210 [Bacteroidota bacterium]|jgi:outer membrane protein
MKKLLLIIAITALATVATAQNTKFGHINSAELIAAMPATKQADSTLKKFAETLDAQYRQMGMDYQTKLGKYQQQRDSLPDAVRKVKEQELEDLGRRIQEYEASAQENLTKKKEELYSPILKRAEDAIKELAKEKSYSYIFDTSVGAVVYAIDSDNLMDAIKAKLGIK